MTGYETGAPDAKVALLRWHNSKGKNACVCIISPTVRWKDLCIIVKIGGDVRYENIQTGIIKKFTNIELNDD